MKTQKLEISKKLLAEIDFNNTVSGGMAFFAAQGGKREDGYFMQINAPSVAKEEINIEVADKRFMVYYMINVLEGEVQMPYFLVNLPLLPDVDVDGIDAKFEDNKVYIHAPLNEWGRGERKRFDLE